MFEMPKSEQVERRMKVGAVEYSEKNVVEIIDLEKETFPEAWQYDDAVEHYTDALQNSNNINIGLRNEEGKLVGYLLAIPYNSLLEDKEFLAADPNLASEPKNDVYYIETMEISPVYRKGISGGKYFFSMLEDMFREAKTRFGVHRFSMHARVDTRLSQAIQKGFGQAITKVRRIKNWPFYGGQESTDYIEGDLELWQEHEQRGRGQDSGLPTQFAKSPKR